MERAAIGYTADVALLISAHAPQSPPDFKPLAPLPPKVYFTLY